MVCRCVVKFAWYAGVALLEGEGGAADQAAAAASPLDQSLRGSAGSSLTGCIHRRSLPLQRRRTPAASSQVESLLHHDRLPLPLRLPRRLALTARARQNGHHQPVRKDSLYCGDQCVPEHIRHESFVDVIGGPLAESAASCILRCAALEVFRTGLRSGAMVPAAAPSLLVAFLWATYSCVGAPAIKYVCLLSCVNDSR